MRAAETISAARMMGEQHWAIPVLGHPEEVLTVNVLQQPHDQTVNQDLQVSNPQSGKIVKFLPIRELGKEPSTSI